MPVGLDRRAPSPSRLCRRWFPMCTTPYRRHCRCGGLAIAGVAYRTVLWRTLSGRPCERTVRWVCCVTGAVCGFGATHEEVPQGVRYEGALGVQGSRLQPRVCRTSMCVWLHERAYGFGHALGSSTVQLKQQSATHLLAGQLWRITRQAAPLLAAGLALCELHAVLHRACTVRLQYPRLRVGHCLRHHSPRPPQG